MRAFPILVVLVLVAAAYWYSDGIPEAAPTEVVATEILPRYDLRDAHLLRTGPSGEPEFEAQAKAIKVYADDSMTLEQVTVASLGGTNSPWLLEAPAGRAMRSERRLELFGTVQAEGQLSDESRVRFTAPQLWVDLLKRELYTREQVHLWNEFRTVRARGLRADFDGDRLQLLQDVQVDYAPRS